MTKSLRVRAQEAGAATADSLTAPDTHLSGEAIGHMLAATGPFPTAIHPPQATLYGTTYELANTIYGNDGANILDGKGGSDILIGRAGGDHFAFTSALGAGNVDRLLDFVSGSDKIQLDDAIFTALGGPGALNASAFVTGTAAADAGDRIIYNAATGQLFYDADGNLGGAAVLFATLSGTPALGASDFQVI